MSEKLVLKPTSHFSGEITVPGSKSISNRVLLMGALAEGKSEFSGILESDDTRYMRDALEKLGKAVNANFPNKKADLFLGNAGTAMRSLTAVLCLGDGEYVLQGEPRMHERPIKDLVDALSSLVFWKAMTPDI